LDAGWTAESWYKFCFSLYHTGNRFLNSILKSNLITIVGSPDELEKPQTEGRVRTHKASKKELNELWALIARDLEDAAIQDLTIVGSPPQRRVADGKNVQGVHRLSARKHTGSSPAHV